MLAEPLYPGDECRLTVGEATTQFQQIVKKGRLSQSSISELYAFLHNFLLPTTNKMPANSRKAAKLLAEFSAKFQISPCSRNDWIVFSEKNELLDECPVCHEPVFVDNKPVKKFRHVLLIATLQQLYQTPQSAKIMEAPSANLDVMKDTWGKLQTCPIELCALEGHCKD